MGLRLQRSADCLVNARDVGLTPANAVKTAKPIIEPPRAFDDSNNPRRTQQDVIEQ
jgi:hypothetical protein